MVIGQGFLGNYIVNECLQNEIPVIGTHYNINFNDKLKMDIQDINSIFDCVTKIQPDLIINCASNIKIDYLEKNISCAFSINANGAKNVATVANKHGIRLAHISTDSVFDGKRGMYSEEDTPNPINVYAKSKLLGEQLVTENSNNHVIIRTNFYGMNQNKDFLFNWVLKNLQHNTPITGFTDVIFTPLEISNLSKMILEISNLEYDGIIHLASDEVLSKYEFVLRIATILGFDCDLIKKGSIDENVGFIAKRPKNTSLSNKKSKKLLETKIISLTDWLHDIKKIN